jgi:moderate conductance mechanosensitive channel
MGATAIVVDLPFISMIVPRMTRLLLVLGLLFAVSAGAFAAGPDDAPDAQPAPPAAQSPPAATEPAPAPSAAPARPATARPPAAAAKPASGTITPDQARVALDVLNDPAKRAAFAATLNALVKAGAPGAEPALPAAKTTVEGIIIPLAPDSLGAQVLVSGSDFVSRLGNEAMDALDAAQSLPLLYGWMVVMATNPTALDLLEDVIWRLAIAVAAAAFVAFGLRWAMQRPIHSLEAIAPAYEPAPNADPDRTAHGRPKPAAWVLLRRVPLVLARLGLELLPVLGIVLIGHVLAGSRIGGHEVSRLVILAVIDSFAVCMALLSVARMLLSPGESRLRLFHLPDTAAAYLMYWTRRLVLVAVFGYALGQVGLLLGLSPDAHDLFEKTIALVLHVMVAIMIIQKRRPVRRFLRAKEGKTGFAAALRNRFAAAWHWIAVFFLFSTWLVWAIEVPHGFTALLRFSVITALVLIGARLTIVVILGVIERGIQVPKGTAAPAATSVAARLSVYYPAVAMVVRVIIWLLSALGLLQLYGANTFLWLTDSSLGQRILGASVTILVTIAVALLVWEAANLSVHHHLDRLQREAQLARSARLRTLLPLLRTTLLICIAVFAGLGVLSEIGINVAPLLAGAGIVGVAIGFGSQKLVQDLINGIFLLLENAMQVGDFVTVSGLSGTVEALSVRAIRLRASDGSVHLIPFSAVTSVTNVNRGLGNASISVTVTYAEDIERVMAELKSLVSDMRDDPALSALMLSDLQLWGVDKVDGGGVTVLGQVVCTDTGRWTVQREFNRRMKARFQEVGIHMFNPLQRIEVAAHVPQRRIESTADDSRDEQRIDHEQPHAAD